MDYIDFVESDAYEAEQDGFTEIDPQGKSHNVVYDAREIAPHIEEMTWWCETHNKLYYGGCNKVDQPYGR